MDSATEKKTKLSVRKQTNFKKQRPSSVNIPATNKKTNLSMREKTLLTKAYELSTLCGIEVCVIHYGPDGELKTYPEDQSKFRDMAERFNSLSDLERRKKSNNLSQFLEKKMNKEKQTSLDQNDKKFQTKVLEMEQSLETRLQVLQDKLRFLISNKITEPGQSLAVAASMITEQNNNDFSTDLSSSDPLMTLLTDVYNSGGFVIDSSNHHQDKFSVFLYNHENDSLTQLPDSGSSSNLGYNNMSMGLLGAQGSFGGDGIGLRSCSNNNIPTPFYGGDPMMSCFYN